MSANDIEVFARTFGAKRDREIHMVHTTMSGGHHSLSLFPFLLIIIRRKTAGIERSGLALSARREDCESSSRTTILAVFL